jgi:multiple sugar transport system ATP-binding protein
MNFLPFEAALNKGSETVQIGPACVAVPALRQDVPQSALLCGVRPEHVHFADDSALRAEVLGTEYLGMSQIVTVATASGTTLRAKVGGDLPVVRGDRVGLSFDASAVSLFDQASGRVLQTARDDHPLAAHARVSRTQVGARHG